MLGVDGPLTWVIVGAVSGWLAGLIIEGYGFGLLGNIVLGSLGAAIASIAVWSINVEVQTTFGGILAATCGAIVVLVFAGLLRRMKRSRH